VQKGFCSFSPLSPWLCIFWQKNIGAKAARKMMVELTVGAYFTNSLHKSFTPTDPKSAKTLK